MEIKDNKLVLDVEVTPIVHKLKDRKAVKRINKIDHRISVLNRKITGLYNITNATMLHSNELIKDLHNLKDEIEHMPTIHIPLEIKTVTEIKKRFSFSDFISKHGGLIILSFTIIGICCIIMSIFYL